MEFNINKGATLPVLKMALINDGRNDFGRFHEAIQDADLVFSMTNVETGIKKIGRRIATTQLKVPEDCCGEEFYLTFQFTAKDTNTAGRYIGQFEITFGDGSGVLIVPIQEELYVNIQDGSIKK